MALKSGLAWYWDLSAADATIADSHGGLEVTKIGTVDTLPTGGPDGGPCIDLGAAAGKYRNGSVPEISYDDGYTVNIWAYSTASSSTFNYLLAHRESSTGAFYFQVCTRSTLGGLEGDFGLTWYGSAASRAANTAAESLDVWQMLTLRDTGTATEIWRNGVLLSTNSATPGTVSTGSAPLAFGALPADETIILRGQEHRGSLAMAGVWERPLDEAEIVELFNGGDGLRYEDISQPQRRQFAAAQIAMNGWG
jgi:hypothetical protein